MEDVEHITGLEGAWEARRLFEDSLRPFGNVPCDLDPSFFPRGFHDLHELIEENTFQVEEEGLWEKF